MKDFFNFDAREAQAFLEMFVERAGPRLAEFKREVAARGGPSVDELDGSVRSLVGLWTWFVEHVGDGGGEYPPWVDIPPHGGDPAVAACLHDVDGLAHYLAEVFQRAMPDLAWGLLETDPRMQAETQNRPMLVSDKDFIDVLVIAQVKYRKQARGKDRDPEALVRLLAAYGVTP